MSMTRAGGYKIDLHVHTSRYSPCSHLAPEDLAALIPDSGLDGIVISEHDWQWSPDEIKGLQESVEHVRLYSAVEVSLAEGHFLVVGMTHEGAFDPNLSLRDLSDRARQDNAALIWAHPGRFGGTSIEPGLVDAVEVMSFNIKGKQTRLIRENHQKLRVPAVAASDSHRPISLGTYATLFPRLPSSEQELAGMIRSSEGVPWANEQQLTLLNDQISSTEEKYLVKSPV